MSIKRTYTEDNFPIEYTYSDSKDHVIRVSNTISEINVRGENAATVDDRIVEFNSGNNIKQISPSCFMNCRSLEKVTLQESTDEIGDDAFRNCKSLSNLNLDGKVFSYIGSNAFRNTSLTSLNCEYYLKPYSIQLSGNQIDVSSYGENIFSNNQKLETVNLTTNVLTEGLFRNCNNLKNVKINISCGQDEFDIYGDNIFYSCDILSSIKLNGDFTILPSFKGLSALHKCNLSSTSGFQIGEKVFRKCSNLTSITFDENINETNLDDKAFSGSSLRKITFKGMDAKKIKSFTNKGETHRPKYIESKNEGLEEITGIKLLIDSETKDDFKYGTIYKNCARLIKYASEKHIPVVLFFGLDKCGLSHGHYSSATFFQNEIFIQYLKQQPCLFGYFGRLDSRYGSSVGHFKDVDDYTPRGIEPESVGQSAQIKIKGKYYPVYVHKENAYNNWKLYDVLSSCNEKGGIEWKPDFQTVVQPNKDIYTVYDIINNTFAYDSLEKCPPRCLAGISYWFYYLPENAKKPMCSVNDVIGLYSYNNVRHSYARVSDNEYITKDWIRNNIETIYNAIVQNRSTLYVERDNIWSESDKQLFSLYPWMFVYDNGLNGKDIGTLDDIYLTGSTIRKIFEKNYDMSDKNDKEEFIDLLLNYKSKAYYVPIFGYTQGVLGVTYEWYIREEGLYFTESGYLLRWYGSYDQLKGDMHSIYTAEGTANILSTYFQIKFDGFFKGYERDDSLNPTGYVKGLDVLKKYEYQVNDFNCWGIGHDCTLIAKDGSSYKYNK